MALSISRRSFMKCVGITAFATATGTLMTGCAMGSITGDFGGPFPLSESVDVAVYKIQSSEFDVDLSQIGDYLDQKWIDLPFGLNISDLTGYVCTMPEAVIQNNSDQTLLVLPYFTQNGLETVVDDLAKEYLRKPENQKTITEALEKYLETHEADVAELLQDVEKLVITTVNLGFLGKHDITVGTLLTAIRGLLSSTSPASVEDFLLNGGKISVIVTEIDIPGLSSWDDKYPDVTKSILEEVVKLLKTDVLEKLGDALNLLMVQGLFDGNTGESDLDQILNVASAGYALLRDKPTLMTNTINPGATVTGLLPVTSKRRWKTMFLRFIPNNLLLSFQDGFTPNWDKTADLIVKVLVYLFFKNDSAESTNCLKAIADPAVQLVADSMDYLNYNIQSGAGSLTLRFENGSTI